MNGWLDQLLQSSSTEINPDAPAGAAVIGTGMMGPGIATILSAGGVPVTILSRNDDSAAQARVRAMEFGDLLAAHGLAPKQRAPIFSSADMDHVVPRVLLVIESAPEDMAFKQELFARLDALAPARAILASNTSGLSITDIASRCKHPERVMTTHFWNPPHLMPLVEIVRGEKTDPELANEVRTLLERCGKTAVMVKKDTPGQLGNRIQSAVKRECMHILAEGIADVEDIDLAVKNGFGLRYPVYGPFEHLDAIGLDMGAAISDYVSRDLSNEVGVPRALREHLDRGELGVKSGKGFYDWTKKDWGQVKRLRDDFVLETVKRWRHKGNTAD